MIRKRILGSALLLASLLAAPAQAAVQVLTSIKPLQLIAAAIQEGTGSTPDVLLPPGASPHEYSLRPSDLRKLQEAGLFYWIGADMEVFLKQPLAVRSGPSLAVQDLPELALRHFGEHDAHASAHGEPVADDDHDHAHQPGSLDAHLWLLPGNARLIAQRMTADLSAADPDNAATYQANYKAFSQRLNNLEAYLHDRLKPLQRKPFFVFHEAFDYFEQAYGLQHRGVFAISSEVQPGAQHVAAMREQLQAAGASCIFSEPPQPPRLARTLSQGLPVTLATLDALGYDLAVDGHGYEALLSRLGNGLADCLEKL